MILWQDDGIASKCWNVQKYMDILNSGLFLLSSAGTHCGKQLSALKSQVANSLHNIKQCVCKPWEFKEKGRFSLMEKSTESLRGRAKVENVLMYCKTTTCCSKLLHGRWQNDARNAWWKHCFYVRISCIKKKTKVFVCLLSFMYHKWLYMFPLRFICMVFTPKFSQGW